jgi:hypothetical protein
VFRGVRGEGLDEALAVQGWLVGLAWSGQWVNLRTQYPRVGFRARSFVLRLPCPSRGRSRTSFVFLHRSIGRLPSCCIG